MEGREEWKFFPRFHPSNLPMLQAKEGISQILIDRKEKIQMFEVQLPALRKLQNVAGTAAGIGFILGLLIPVAAIFVLNWHCPFGDGILQVVGFLALTAIGGAIVIGNLTAIVSIAVAKYRRTVSDSSKKRRS